MADVIGTELHFKPVFGDMARRDCHYAGIVDEQVDAWKRGGETGGAVCHRCQTCQIERFETHLGAGMGAAQTAGSAVSLAVSTPIAIFDPRTRRNYDSQVRRLGQSMNNTVGSVGDSVGAGLPEDPQ